MVSDVAGSRLLRWARREWLLLAASTLAAALALCDPQPLARQVVWLRWPTLGALAGLMAATQAIQDSGLVQRAAWALARRSHGLRTLGLTLVAASALLSMLLTNDVGLLLMVPLTLALGERTQLPVPRMVVLEALAVNAGSSLSPIGNPQNLLLWQHARLSFAGFASAMLPAAATMLALLFGLTALWLPRGPLAAGDSMEEAPLAPRSGLLGVAGLVAMVSLIQLDHPWLGAIALLLALALCAPASLRRLDWLLWSSFMAIFLALGHLAALPQLGVLLGHIDFRDPLLVYLGGIVAAQAISNVPATVLLIDHVRDPIALAVAVNVGGFGLATGSLANLIALRLARLPHGLARLHAASIPFLLVAAPLAYAAWRLFG